MWCNVRILFGVGTGLGTGFGVFKLRQSSAENQMKSPFSLAVPPQEDIRRLHKCPYLSWDYNWDRRAKLKKDANGNLTIDDSKNAKLRRYLILINDCHYVNNEESDAPSMTALGESQAQALVRFLVDWLGWEEWLPNTTIVHSPLKRSRKLAKIISKEMATIPVRELELLEEGLPTARSPPPMDDPVSPNKVHTDYPRMEAGFRALFYRPAPTQKEQSVEIVLAHPNVIRYFVCRALQLPPEAFSRFSLKHASMTRIEIFGNGVVNVVSVGDTGYLTPDKFTFGEIEAVLPVL
ncbi:hypothetical protein GE061_001803 [Apolygus lucorum]|uniref:Serine/threonine-protein phosphatase PGAM5, mitochondrial n=1 Tax=Apolygus lucorum TaxID=248454 RepID=A0A8S9X3A9_APOLU|nr:hypothetical protein GE061_001803 [Apolygus lucorum]